VFYYSIDEFWPVERTKTGAVESNGHLSLSIARTHRGDPRAVLPIQEGLVDTSNAPFFGLRALSDALSNTLTLMSVGAFGFLFA